MVEFALLLPVLLFLAFGIFEFGRAYYTYSAIANAANEGARYGTVYPTDTNGIKNRAIQRAVGIDLTAGNVTVSPVSPCVIDSPIVVTVQYQFTADVFMVPSFMMNRSASMRISQCR